MNIAITLAKNKSWQEWLEKANNNKKIYYSVGKSRLPNKAKEGDKCFVVYNGIVKGYYIIKDFLSKNEIIYDNLTNKELKSNEQIKEKTNYVITETYFNPIKDKIKLGSFGGFKYIKSSIKRYHKSKHNDLRLKQNPNISPPNNESNKHFLLKQVALAYLKEKRLCKWIADEVMVQSLQNIEMIDKLEFAEPKERTDAIGLDFKYDRKKGKYKSTIYNIEVKVSKSDFKNGYTIAGDYNYIIAPKGILNPKDLPFFLGLLEVDLEKLRWNKKRIEGIESVKNAHKTGTNFSKKDIEYLKDKILARLSNDKIYKNNWFYQGIKLEENKKEN